MKRTNERDDPAQIELKKTRQPPTSNELRKINVLDGATKRKQRKDDSAQDKLR